MHDGFIIAAIGAPILIRTVASTEKKVDVSFPDSAVTGTNLNTGNCV
jgi:hypothetical protein